MWYRCPCCPSSSSTPPHAVLRVTDGSTGDALRLKVPWENRHHAWGWEKDRVVSWKGQDGKDRQGRQVSSGAKGVTAVNAEGVAHFLENGQYQPVIPRKMNNAWVEGLKKGLSAQIDRLIIAPLLKAKPLKEGQRWITVHPNGPDSKGVPVLVQKESDGTHRIIAGAGGKLTHLRHLTLKSPEEYAAASKQKKEEAKAAKKQQRAAMSPDAKDAEKTAKTIAERENWLSQRAFIDTVKKRLGGIAENLDEEKLAGLSKGTKNLIITRHHNMQMRQAQKAAEGAMKKLVDDRIQNVMASETLKKSIEEKPEVAEVARQMADEELRMSDLERSERAAQRRQNKMRQTTGQTKVGEKAADKISETILAHEDPVKKLTALGGRDDDPGGVHEKLSASGEIVRRSLQAKQDALILASAAVGKEAPVDKEVADRVVKKALAKAGVALDAPEEEKRDVLATAASAQQIRSEVQEARVEKFRKLEVDHGDDVAAQCLAFADSAANLAKGVADARAKGLINVETAPLQEPEIEALHEVLKSKATLREAQKAAAAMVKAAATGDTGESATGDKSRRAVDLKIAPISDDKIDISIEDEIRREMTERLLGLSSNRRGEHLTALSNGHYDALADIGLGVGGQRYIDRPVVDGIGAGNAALLLRHGMEEDGHDPKVVLEALEKHHVKQVDSLTAEALSRAEKLAPNIQAQVESAGDIEKALGQLDVHEQDAADLHKMIGSTLGRLEATATAAQAFRRPLPAEMTLSSGENKDIKGTVQWVHSLGLKPEHYELNYETGQIKIPRENWGLLMNKIPASEVKARQEAMAIKSGKLDTPGWLPAGIVSREASSFTAPLPEHPRYWEPLKTDGDNWKESLEAHVGSRLADGEHPADILSDVLSAKSRGSAKDPAAYTEAVKALFPMQNEEGKIVKYDTLKDHFQGLAEKHMTEKYGSASGAFHAQNLEPEDPKTREALFRSLAEHPEAVAAFTPVGQHTPQLQRAILDHFYQRMGYDPKDRSDRANFEREKASLGPEPDKNANLQFSMFGGGPSESAEWKEWDNKRRSILARYPKEGLEERLRLAGGDPEAIAKAKQEASEVLSPWDRYIMAHGSRLLAVQALQDEMRGNFAETFAKHYGRVTGRPLRVGLAPITNQERHVRATAGQERAEELIRQQQAAMGSLRQRIGGKFAAEGEGAVKQKYTNWLEQGEIDRQNQGSMFGARPTEVLAPEKAPVLRPPGEGERHSLGERAENQIQSLMHGALAEPFEAGKPINLPKGLNMDGPRIHQQRVVKLVQRERRVGAYLGTGSGKSLASIGAFTEAHSRGDTQHGLYLVPTAVAQQFGGEMLRFTKPGAYRWGVSTDKGHDERVAMLKDPSIHMRVMTHQAFRDTTLKLVAKHEGITETKAKENLSGMTAKDRAATVRKAFDAEGIPRHFTYVDEAHMATSRGGGDPSGVHMIVQAVSHPLNATHLILGTATPHKNDEGEVYSMAAMLNPDKYADRHTFMQNFGSDMRFNPQAIRQELAHSTYTARVDPEGVDRTDTDNPVVVPGSPGGMFGPGSPPKKAAGGAPLPLNPDHQKLVEEVDKAYEAARLGRMAGRPDVAAMKTLSPRAFEGKPEVEHEAIAGDLSRSLGVIRESALRRVINQAPPEINTKLKAMTEVVKHDLQHGTWTDRAGQENKGKPSIIFTDSKREARMIHEHLTRHGLRSALYHGELSPSEREEVVKGYQPETGAPRHDVIVATSAAEAGINLQRAKVLHHFDVPLTEKSHAQRSGRAYRQGQQGDVEIHNWHTDTPYEQNALRRLKRKAELGAVFQSPTSHTDETGIGFEYQRALNERHQGGETVAGTTPSAIHFPALGNRSIHHESGEVVHPVTGHRLDLEAAQGQTPEALSSALRLHPGHAADLADAAKRKAA